MQANTQRIAQIEAEIQGLEGSIALEPSVSSALMPEASAVSALATAAPAAEREWLPAAFAGHLRPGATATVQVNATQVCCKHALTSAGS